MSKTILDFPSFNEIFNTEFRNTLPCFVAPAGISARRQNPKGASYSHVIAHTYIYRKVPMVKICRRYSTPENLIFLNRGREELLGNDNVSALNARKLWNG